MNENGTTLDWELIDRAALALGVKEPNLKKWRLRKSVPHRWRLPIIKHTKGLISADAFDDFPRKDAGARP